MKEKKKDFLMLLEDLCYIYEDYAKKNNAGKINVFINNNMIKIYLLSDMEIVDEFGLDFNVSEKDKYQYISIALMKILFGSSVIYSENDIIYNDEDKPYIKMYVADEDVLRRMINTISFYREMDFYDRIGEGKRTRNKINRTRNVNNLRERVELTSILIKKREKK